MKTKKLTVQEIDKIMELLKQKIDNASLEELEEAMKILNVNIERIGSGK